MKHGDARARCANLLWFWVGNVKSFLHLAVTILRAKRLERYTFVYDYLQYVSNRKTRLNKWPRSRRNFVQTNNGEYKINEKYIKMGEA